MVEENKGEKLSLYQRFKVGVPRALANTLTSIGILGPHNIGQPNTEVVDGVYNADQRDLALEALDKERNVLVKLKHNDRSRTFWESPHHVDGVTPTGSPVDEEDIARGFRPRLAKPSTWIYFFSSKKPLGLTSPEVANECTLAVSTDLEAAPKSVTKKKFFPLTI